MVVELSDEEISKFYEGEPLFAKIRCKICECGRPVFWDELKSSHDRVLEEYREGKELLLQNGN